MLTPSQVSSSDTVNVPDLEGCLVVLQATGPESTADTVRGPAQYIPARVLVVEGAAELAGAWHELWIFPKVLLGMLRKANGQPLAGVVGKGTARAGQSAPWILLDAEGGDMAKAQAAYDQATRPAVTSPTAVGGQAPPAPAPAPTPAPQQYEQAPF